MPANIGRNLKINKNSTVLAGIRAKTLTANGEPVDITTDDENGYRTLLAEEGQRAIDMSFEGVTKDDVLRKAMLTGGSLLLTDIDIAYPNGDTITGDFFFNSLEETGNYNDSVTFSGTMQSSGAWTYTPATP